MSTEAPVRKSYLIPALEVPAFDALLNGFDRVAFSNKRKNGKRIYESNLDIFWDNTFHGHWVIDDDAFNTNQLGHPYQGTVYQGLARSAGLGFWEAFPYTIAGSFLWETAGETTHPSINDMVATGVAGNFFGEPLFRMANLLLEGGGGRPGLWRELGAAALSPPTGLNRLVFGDRFKPVFPSHDPAIFWRFGIGESFNSHGGGLVSESVPSADFAMYYGLPGKEGYSYERPFDYFSFQAGAGAYAKNALENIMVNGLLFGDKYASGMDYRGIWGVYGIYDYMSPNLFKASNTAVALGTTAQWDISPMSALQGTVLAGAGYGAAGVDKGDTRTYRYGTTLEGTTDLRLNLRDVAQLEAGVREYYVSRLGGTRPKGSELITRVNAGISVRVYKKHALGFRYVSNLRDSEAAGLPDRRQSVETYSIFYTFLSDTFFGTVPR